MEFDFDDDKTAHYLPSMIGKTIKSIDTSSTNAWAMYFTDDTSIRIWSEVGSGKYSVPYLYLDKGE